MLTCDKLMPSRLTSSIGRQQSSMYSWNHRHTPFQRRLGSIARAFSTIARLASPQNAGSSCVLPRTASEHLYHSLDAPMFTAHVLANRSSSPAPTCSPLFGTNAHCMSTEVWSAFYNLDACKVVLPESRAHAAHQAACVLVPGAQHR